MGSYDWMGAVKVLSSLLLAILMAACSGPSQTLVVKSYQLRNQTRDTEEEPMLRMEKARRLHGAVSMNERRQRLGQYYTLIWTDPTGTNLAPVKVVFEYQQGQTASRIHRLTKSFDSSSAHGRAEFAVTGDTYFNGGRVLAWKASVWRGSRELASKQSYLWQNPSRKSEMDG